MEIKIKIDGTAGEGFKRYIRDLSIHKRKTLEVIKEEMYHDVLDHFEKEMGDNGKWEKLKDSTIAQRKKKGYWPGKILQQTGTLKRSVTSRVFRDKAIVGTNLEYAEPVNKIRKFLYLSKVSRSDIDVMIKDYYKFKNKLKRGMKK
jgi:phage gpG-like protein